MVAAEQNGRMSLVLVDADSCLDCGGPTTTIQWDQLPLFRHGGYGAARSTSLRHCAAFCGWYVVEQVSETNPRAARRRGEPRTLASTHRTRRTSHAGS